MIAEIFIAMAVACGLNGQCIVLADTHIPHPTMELCEKYLAETLVDVPKEIKVKGTCVKLQYPTGKRPKGNTET